MKRLVFLPVLSALALGLPVPMVRAECRLCTPDAAEGAPTIPINIEVYASLDFSRVALDQGDGGEVTIDSRSGGRKVSGGLNDLGGYAVRGEVRITGEPGRPIRVELPNRVEMRSSSGATAHIHGLETTLPAAPRIGADGTLSFSFGGRLSVKGQNSGNFRGSIPITADYL
jgi:hypothetical protein